MTSPNLLSLKKEPSAGLGSPASVIRHLHEQHTVDLKVYRSAHREWKNRVLHWYLIPVECWAALLFLWILVTFLTNEMDSSSMLQRHHHYTSSTVLVSSVLRLVPKYTTILLGLLSLVIATNSWIGLATFLYHIAVLWSCEALMDRCDQGYLWLATGIAGVAWTLAWAVQVGVGHLVFERNLPNVANIQQVSYLAMCQSVLIAWSS